MDNRNIVITYNTEKLFAEITRCHEIDTSDPRGNTDYALKHLPRIINLLEQGVNFAATSNGYTPIRLAAHHGLWDIVIAMAEQKNLPKDIQDDKYGFNEVLLYAVGYNSLASCTALLKAGASQSKQYYNYRVGNKQIHANCLHVAICNKNKSILRWLLHYASDYDLAFQDAKGRTPLLSAAEKKYWKMSFLIVSHSKYTKDFDHILPWTVQDKMHDLIHLLLQNGAKQTCFISNKKGDIRNFPLHIAVMNDDMKSLNLLIDFGGNAEQTNGIANDIGLTPYQLACQKNHGQCAKLLLNQKAIQFNHASKDAFDKAVKKKKWDVADAIVRATGGPNHFSMKDDGNTILHNIIINWVHLGIHAKPMFIYAYKHGAKLTRENYLYETPVELAAKLKNWQVIELCLHIIKKLKPKKMHWEQVLHEAIKAENVAIVASLLERGLRCDAYDMQMGNIALCLAVNTKNSKILSLLLTHGADPDMQTQSGMTTYHLAREVGDAGCLEVLNHYQREMQNKHKDSRKGFNVSLQIPAASTPPLVSSTGLFSTGNKTVESVVVPDNNMGLHPPPGMK